jgi:hypothetical protein
MKKIQKIINDSLPAFAYKYPGLRLASCWCQRDDTTSAGCGWAQFGHQGCAKEAVAWGAPKCSTIPHPFAPVRALSETFWCFPLMPAPCCNRCRCSLDSFPVRESTGSEPFERLVGGRRSRRSRRIVRSQVPRPLHAGSTPLLARRLIASLDPS